MRPLWAALLGLLAGCRASITSVGEFSRDSGAHLGSTVSSDAAAGDSGRPDAASIPAFYIEAERGALSGGFTVESDAATSGGAFITGPAGVTSTTDPGAARAVYQLSIAVTASYYIWGRIDSPGVEHNAVWFRIDTGPFYIWRLSTGDDWYWGSFHDNTEYGVPLRFELAAGDHVLELANYDDGVGLDRFYVTAHGETPPGNDTPCHPPDSVRLAGACVPSCGSHGGTTCRTDVCAGRMPLPAYDCAVCCTAP